MFKSYISTDIDGVLNYYPRPLINFVNDKYSTNFQDKDSIKLNFSKEEYENIKNLYRKSDYKAKMKFNNAAANAIKKFATKHNFGIIVSTSRRIFNIEMLQLTKKWLNENNFEYQGIYYKYDVINKSSNIKNFFAHIDDQKEFIDLFINIGIPAITYNSQFEEDIFFSNKLFTLLEEIK